MHPRSEPPPPPSEPLAIHSLRPGASSWTSLLAATTLGLEAPSHVHARVHCARSELRGSRGGRFRLVVQMYRVDSSMQSDGIHVSGKPLGFAERRVDLEQLLAGVDLDVVEFESEPRGTRRLVAWLQRVDRHDDDHRMGARPADAEWHASEIWAGSEPVVLTLRRGSL